MDVQALIFDVFGTVVDWRGGVIRAGRELSERAGSAAAVDWAAVADDWRGRYRPSMDRVRRGELPWTDLDQLHRMSLDQLLPDHGADRLSEAERTHLVGAWHRLDPWPDSVPGLTRLRRRYVVAPLSNGHVALLVAMARRAGLPWDLVLSAELVHAYKPDPATYLSAPRLLALPADQVMMVAAHLDDLAAARANGLRTAYVRRPEECGPAGTAPEPEPDDQPDFVVDSITELADRLGA